MPSFADMLAYLRKRAGYSQTELADKLKISRSAIGMYESGKRESDFETLEWGSRGRWFKSSHSDQKYREIGQNGWFPELFYEHIFLQNVL